MADFICPVCGAKLNDEGKSLYCPGGHCFDKAKSGYVNLLLSRGAGRHGDDRLMVRARTDFLNAGYYAKLSHRLMEIVCSLADRNSVIVDAGCGEGYYSESIEAKSGSRVIGIDISREAIVASSKRSKSMSLAVASTANMPIKENYADIVLNIFSPLFSDEFSRVLKNGGHLIRVFPLERHLWELKKIVYDEPYENDAPQVEIEGLHLEEMEELKYSITVSDKKMVQNLFVMTPYYYKTGGKDRQKLQQVSELMTQLEFGIAVYRK